VVQLLQNDDTILTIFSLESRQVIAAMYLLMRAVEVIFSQSVFYHSIAADEKSVALLYRRNIECF